MDYKVYIAEVAPTPLGPLWIAVSEKGLVEVEWQTSQEEFIKGIHSRLGKATICVPDAKHTRPARQQLLEYLEGKRARFDLAIDWTGMTSFQEQVLRATLAIPSGQTATYGQIAKQVGRPRAARAVGRVQATNPMPLVIPCHRVVGTDGGLHGYGGPGGIKTKAWLLNMERGVK